MKIFIICPKCGYETELNQDDEYVMCMNDKCKSLLTIEGNAKVKGIVLGQSKEIELKSNIEREARKYIANWRF